MDWSILYSLNDFLYHHDGVEDPLLFYVNVSEALFIATLAVIFLAASGTRHLAWRRAAVAAVLSAGLALAIGKVISEIVDRSLAVQRVGDVFERLAILKQRPDLLPPVVIPLIALRVGQSNILGN